MKSGLSISPLLAVEAALAKASFELPPTSKLIKFPVPELRRFAAREAIFSQGEPAGEVFQIAQGAVMVLRELSGGRRQILDIAGPGRFIGLTRGAAHDCSAVALRDAAVDCHDRRRAHDAFHGVDFTAAMFDEIHRLRDLATSLGRKTAIERLAGFFLATIGGETEAEEPVELMLPVSRQEIADHLGMVVETVCRNFSLLKRQGLIRVEGKYGLTLLDPAALRQIVRGVALPDRLAG
ncbi:helix-turn-helix domain-containing protein [Rhodoblastus sp.]|uniref:helix-turn-helix domain-containing protein n=1 Tax=Rhodoblastus sp. TaxID=1962975 RepID=UPI003F9CF9A2